MSERAPSDTNIGFGQLISGASAKEFRSEHLFDRVGRVLWQLEILPGVLVLRRKRDPEDSDPEDPDSDTGRKSCCVTSFYTY